MLGFGKSFSDHMAIARIAGAWGDVAIVPFADVPLSPAAMVLHYGQAIFEGLKAYRQPDGSVCLFRPADNAARFEQSARRLAMPPLAPQTFLDACDALVRADADCVPSGPGETLYLRPMLFASEAALGVRPADEYLFLVIASPVDAYFGDTVRPITVWADPALVRAAPGGTGAAKCSGNYAASLVAKQTATANGCAEALWLDALHHRFIEELGGMNFMAVRDGTVVTPPLSDTILDGVTRRSLLTLAGDLGYATEERPVTLDELTSGAFDEAFACGTAAVVAPIGGVRSAEGEWTVGDGEPGPVTLQLRDALLAIQEGRAADHQSWRWASAAR
jgi:branched-chain amino acid aminotransferase